MLYIVMLSVDMLYIVILSLDMLNDVFMLSVVMLNVAAPY
jgi:hypothetical protein